MNTSFWIRPVRTQDDIAAVTRLFRTYAASIDIDLTYQSFQKELATLPGRYSPPHGELLLAWNFQGTALGCIAVRPFHHDSRRTEPLPGVEANQPLPPSSSCELKRLYVSLEGRRLGVGEALSKAVIEKAASLGYEEAFMDTVPSMLAALRLYEKLGFIECAPYYDSPIPGTKYFRIMLQGKERLKL